MIEPNFSISINPYFNVFDRTEHLFQLRIFDSGGPSFGEPTTISVVLMTAARGR
jgi:hypothetical protein